MTRSIQAAIPYSVFCRQNHRSKPTVLLNVFGPFICDPEAETNHPVLSGQLPPA